eukprot:4111481-Prymnesium_polylepis.1
MINLEPDECVSNADRSLRHLHLMFDQPQNLTRLNEVGVPNDRLDRVIPGFNLPAWHVAPGPIGAI